MNLYSKLTEELSGIFGIPVSLETQVLQEGTLYLSNLELSLYEQTNGILARFCGEIYSLTKNLSSINPGFLTYKTVNKNGCFNPSEKIGNTTNNGNLFYKCSINFTDFRIMLPITQTINEIDVLVFASS